MRVDYVIMVQYGLDWRESGFRYPAYPSENDLAIFFERCPNTQEIKIEKRYHRTERTSQMATNISGLWTDA